MSIFDYEFVVKAPLAAVAEFHSSTQALALLTPPPMRVQLVNIEPLAEGSRSEFIMWFGPFPVRWVAVHTRVDPLHGFTDTQASGPMAFWQHTHRFEAVDDATTRVHEQIEYRYAGGWRSIWTRVLFSAPGLRFLFAHRSRITRRETEKRHPPAATKNPQSKQ
jgi:ligand-binding SRPBCC domain-containing protein